MSPEFWSDLLAGLPQWLVAIGGVGALGAVLKLGADRRTANAQADRAEVDVGSAVADSAMALLAPLREQVKYLTTQLGDAMREAEAQRRVAEEFRREAAAARMETEQLRFEVGRLRVYLTEVLQLMQQAGLPSPGPVPQPAQRAAPVPPPAAPPGDTRPPRRRRRR